MFVLYNIQTNHSVIHFIKQRGILMKALTTVLDVLARSCAILLFIKFIMSVGNNVFG